MSHWTALSLSLMIILQILQGKTTLELEETHISIYTDRNLNFKIVTADYQVVVFGLLSFSLWEFKYSQVFSSIPFN